MKHADSEYIVIGKVGATYGIQGWLKIYSYTAAAADILTYSPWYLEDASGWKLIEVKTGRQHGKGVVANFAGLNNPEQARLLTGKKIAIKRNTMPALDQGEYYWTDLEGLNVIDQHGNTLGKVAYLMETGANDVLVVKVAGKDHAIPYLPGSVITRVDLANQTIHVNWELV